MWNSAYSIQNFVTRTLESHGAMVEQTGFALVEVLLPEDLGEIFDGRSCVRWAFYYEVAQETEDCQFVTFGSYLLDAVTGLALATGRVVESYVPVPSLEVPSKVAEQIGQTVGFVKCKPPRLKKSYPLEFIYYQFNFRCVFRYDEKREELYSVLVDMHTGRQDSEVQELLPLLQKAIPLEKREHILPQAPVVTMEDAYNRACMAVGPMVRMKMEEIEGGQAGLREKELSKATRYYDRTYEELRRKLFRSRDLERQKRFKQQIAATESDRERRLHDIREKFVVEAEVTLDSIVIYHLPKLNLELEVQQREELFPFEVTFNLLSREVEKSLCPSCGKPVMQLSRTGGNIHCSEGCAKC